MRHRSAASSIAIRAVLLANCVMCAVVGTACLFAYGRPAAFVFAGLGYLAAGVLAVAVRRSDPYRLEAWRAQRAAAARARAARLRDTPGLSSGR